MDPETKTEATEPQDAGQTGVETVEIDEDGLGDLLAGGLLADTSEQPENSPAGNNGEGEPEEPEQTPSGEEDDKLPPEVQERINQRIGKEVGKRKELETQLEQHEAEIADLKSQLDEARNSTPPAPSNASLDSIQTVAELNRKVSQARQLDEWTEELLERVADEPQKVLAELNQEGVKLPEFDADDQEAVRWAKSWLRDTRKAARRVLSVAPERREALQREQQVSEQAERMFPWMKDPRSEHSKKLGELLKAKPQIRQVPGWKLLAGYTLLGVQAAQQLQAKRKSNGTESKRAPAPAGTRKAPPPRATEKTQAAAALKRVHEEGSTDALSDYLAQTMG